MLRIVKFKSPMSLGVWGLVLYSGAAGANVMRELAISGVIPRWMRFLAPGLLDAAAGVARRLHRGLHRRIAFRHARIRCGVRESATFRPRRCVPASVRPARFRRLLSTLEGNHRGRPQARASGDGRRQPPNSRYSRTSRSTPDITASRSLPARAERTSAHVHDPDRNPCADGAQPARQHVCRCRNPSMRCVSRCSIGADARRRLHLARIDGRGGQSYRCAIRTRRSYSQRDRRQHRARLPPRTNHRNRDRTLRRHRAAHARTKASSPRNRSSYA